MAHRALTASSRRRRSRRRPSWRCAASRWRTTATAAATSGSSRHSVTMPNTLVGAAPADMVDQKLRRRQQHQDARARRGIDESHRCRQARTEPAAEQDRIRHIADEGDADADAEADAQLELPQRLRPRGHQEGAAEQKQPERIDRARAGAVEQPADDRRHQPAGQPGQRIDRDHLGAVPAETLGDRFEENRKAVAEAAAEQRQHKAQRKHVERDALRLLRFGGRFSLWRLSVHPTQGARFRDPSARLKNECAHAG